eukprot:scaffold33423_cov42-Phaeocystis_antarctica.AAC.1
MNRHPRSSNRRAARGRDDTTHDTVTGRQREDTGTQAVVADCRLEKGREAKRMYGQQRRSLAQSHIDRTRCRGHRNGSEEATRRPRDVAVREVHDDLRPKHHLDEVVGVLQSQGHGKEDHEAAEGHLLAERDRRAIQEVHRRDGSEHRAKGTPKKLLGNGAHGGGKVRHDAILAIELLRVGQQSQTEAAVVNGTDEGRRLEREAATAEGKRLLHGGLGRLTHLECRGGGERADDQLEHHCMSGSFGCARRRGRALQ